MDVLCCQGCVWNVATSVSLNSGEPTLQEGVQHSSLPAGCAGSTKPKGSLLLAQGLDKRGKGTLSSSPINFYVWEALVPTGCPLVMWH